MPEPEPAATRAGGELPAASESWREYGAARSACQDRLARLGHPAILGAAVNLMCLRIKNMETKWRAVHDREFDARVTIAHYE